MAQRAHGVAGAAGGDLVGADFRPFHARKGELCHGQPVFGGGHVLFALVRGHEGWHDDDLIRRQLPLCRLRDGDVFGVDGIERAAENDDVHGRSPKPLARAPRTPSCREAGSASSAFVFISIAYLCAADKRFAKKHARRGTELSLPKPPQNIFRPNFLARVYLYKKMEIPSQKTERPREKRLREMRLRGRGRGRCGRSLPCGRIPCSFFV